MGIYTESQVEKVLASYFVISENEKPLIEEKKKRDYLIDKLSLANIQKLILFQDPKRRADFEKVKCLEITLTPGKFLYIPAYWWYSFKLGDYSSCIASLKYRTYMNNISILPYICLHALQIQNVKRDVVKKVNISELNNNINENINENNNFRIICKELKAWNWKNVLFR